MIGQMRRIEPRLATINLVGQREQPREIGVALARLAQQHDPRAVEQGQLAAADRLQAEAVGQPRELQGAAEVGVGLGQRGHAQLRRAREQLMPMRGSDAKRMKALRVQLDVGHTRLMHFADTSAARAHPDRA